MFDATPLARRVPAAESAIAHFSGKPFEWGRYDCLRMVAHALREMGHAPPLRAAGKYATLLGAHRALKRTGFATLQDWVDAWGLRRITPAMAMTGDILALPSEIPTMPALGLVLSAGRVLAYAPEIGSAAPVMLLPTIHPLAAWSV